MLEDKNQNNRIDNIDINNIKRQLIDDIIAVIRKYNLDYQQIALELGFADEELLKIILSPQDAKGSELYLLNESVLRRIKK